MMADRFPRFFSLGVCIIALLLQACSNNPSQANSQLQANTAVPTQGVNMSTETIPTPVEPTVTPLPTRGDLVLGPGTKFYIDPYSSPQKQLTALEKVNPEQAALIQRIAEQPMAIWVGGSSVVEQTVADVVAKSSAEGTVAVFVAYNIPLRDCGHYSKGGEASAQAYRDWIDGFVRGLGDAKAVVLVEPDALAHMDCLSSEDTQQRYELLSYAVEQFAKAPNVAAYLDAGNANWHQPNIIAPRLKKAGIEKAAGFSLNVSNFIATDTTIAYGQKVAKAIDPKNPTHFVIDTSRNGLGHFPQDQDPTGENWCNPPGRALGDRPTVDTADPLVDAYLWVKIPGESDGTCRGAPLAGGWWLEYALGLAERAPWAQP